MHICLKCLPAFNNNTFSAQERIYVDYGSVWTELKPMTSFCFGFICNCTTCTIRARTLKVHYINKCFSASFFHSWREWRKNPRKRFVDFQSRNISYPEFFSCICAPNCKQSNSFNFFNNNFYCFNIFSILTIFFQLIQYFLCRLFENRFLCSLVVFYCFFGYFFSRTKK